MKIATRVATIFFGIALILAVVVFVGADTGRRPLNLLSALAGVVVAGATIHHHRANLSIELPSTRLALYAWIGSSVAGFALGPVFSMPAGEALGWCAALNAVVAFSLGEMYRAAIPGVRAKR